MQRKNNNSSIFESDGGILLICSLKYRRTDCTAECLQSGSNLQCRDGGKHLQWGEWRTTGGQHRPLSPLIHQTSKSKIRPLNCENHSAAVGPQREPEAGEAGLLFDGRRRIKLQFGEVGGGA